MAAKYQLLQSDASPLAARDQAGEHPGDFFGLIAKPGMRRCVDETSAGATSSSGMHTCHRSDIRRLLEALGYEDDA